MAEASRSHVMVKIMQGTKDFTFPISAITRYQIKNKIFLATLQKMKENHVQLSTVHPNSSHTHTYSNYTKPRAILDHSITCHPAEVTLLPIPTPKTRYSVYWTWKDEGQNWSRHNRKVHMVHAQDRQLITTRPPVWTSLTHWRKMTGH